MHDASLLKAKCSPTHPVSDAGLGRAHLRVFHQIACGYSSGHNPIILGELEAGGLIQPGVTREWAIPFDVYARFHEWMDAEAGRTLAQPT